MDFTELLNEAVELDEERAKVMMTKAQSNGEEPFDMLQTARDGIKQQEEERARKEEEARLEKLREEASEKIKEIKANLESIESDKPSDKIEAYFDALVPQSGEADTVAGEIARAIERIIYRDYNDGDLFYDGYGVETCGGSAEYLLNVIPELRGDFIEIAVDGLRGDDYTEALEEITSRVIDYIDNHQELIATPNTTNSREGGTNSIDWSDYAPRYEIDILIPSEIMDYVDEGIIDLFDVANEVEGWYSPSGFIEKMVRPSGEYLYFEDLTSEQYDEAEEFFTDSVWEEYRSQLEDEYGDPFQEDEEDLEEDED